MSKVQAPPMKADPASDGTPMEAVVSIPVTTVQPAEKNCCQQFSEDMFTGMSVSAAILLTLARATVTHSEVTRTLS